jgi:hypothetical protein
MRLVSFEAIQQLHLAFLIELQLFQPATLLEKYFANGELFLVLGIKDNARLKDGKCFKH